MSPEQSRNEAWFLTDKMAHELRLSSFQWDDVYEVNYDYFRALEHVTVSYASINRLREQKLQFILTPSQWMQFNRINYFHTPVAVVNGSWSFSIYNHYNRGMFFDRNHAVVHSYNGHHNNMAHYYQGRHNTNRNHNSFGPAHNNNHNSMAVRNPGNNGRGHVTQQNNRRH